VVAQFWAVTGDRPYRMILDNRNDPMNVIGHDNEGVDFYIWILQWDFVPYRFSHLSSGIQPHFTIDYLTEQMDAIQGTDGNEIGTGLGVVIILQTYRSAFSSIGSSGHGFPLVHDNT